MGYWGLFKKPQHRFFSVQLAMESSKGFSLLLRISNAVVERGVLSNELGEKLARKSSWTRQLVLTDAPRKIQNLEIQLSQNLSILVEYANNAMYLFF